MNQKSLYNNPLMFAVMKLFQKLQFYNTKIVSLHLSLSLFPSLPMSLCLTHSTSYPTTHSLLFELCIFIDVLANYTKEKED